MKQAAVRMDTLRVLVCAVLFLLLPARPLSAATGNTSSNAFVYYHSTGHIDADIQSGDLVSLLENISAATGWHVFLDPGARHTVSAKFKDLPTGEALHMLLGDVNFAVLPQTNGTSRLFVFRTAQRQATRLIQAPAKPAKPIPNQLIVTLKRGSKTKIEDLARSLGAKIIGRMDSQNAYLLQFEDEAATQAARDQLITNPDVASVDSNYAVDRPPSLDISQSSTPDLQLKPKANDNNCQLVIGMIDTPVQSLGSNLNSFLNPAIHVAGDCVPDASQLTHGTAMAQTILRAVQAKTRGTTSVKILPIDVYGCSETTTTFDLANGIKTAADNGATMLSMSLGSTGDSSFLHNIITQVAQRNIPMYAAAGNQPVTTPTYPAAYPEVVAVTASDTTGQIASYANRGSFIDMMAPGDNVVGYNGQSYLVEGTSTSTAFASGMAAGLADASHACADQAESLLKQSLKSTSLPAQ